ncbi:MAG: hypothetical protein JOZ41_18455 [Chloroflexi bacterium]|nr:hypothetical protein [Chloroflexota bacterium]
MIHRMACTCGFVFHGEDEELYSLVYGHVDRLHPERHQLLWVEQVASGTPAEPPIPASSGGVLSHTGRPGHGPGSPVR